MPNKSPSRFSILLSEVKQGSREAQSELILLVYQDLRRIAQSYLNRERPGQTLQATALVHEAYMRLFGERQVDWRGRNHFLLIAARQMRHILVEHARSAHAAKRNGNGHTVPIEEAAALLPLRYADPVRLDDALQSLAKLHPRAAQGVKLRFYAGLTEEQIATVLGISVTTVKREWKFARAWLRRELSGHGWNLNGAVRGA
jgi:RNA polymerase sigma factor (TIGR02999 family)